ncbi:hypothetical protein O6H91_05G047300 [Diphasiastrum complanatum]|uniref:Uncharacterized protein n=1 Tax=Diphasiastrum complanatum TaxID=34168 RepID=A0ACC2DMZ0_DIPCM|nr:hypothetical protein O6H91_05G047300 [Diphasiastrum complanatum]
MEWESKQPLNKVEELEDMVLAQSMIEARQKRNAAEGKLENIQEVIRIVKDRFEEDRHVPRKSAHLLKEKKAMMDHQALLKRIRVQNQLLVSRARKVHEQEIAALIQKNKMNYELARNLWMQELKVARIANQQKLDMLERWKQSVKAIKESNAHLLTNAKEQFQKDLQHVEENNRVMLQRARDDYDFEVKTVRAWNEAAIADRELKQKELDNNVAVRNKASRAHYEETLNALKVENKQLLEKAHADYNEKLSYTRTENERIMKQNEIELNRKCEETRMKNTMRKEALQKTLESIKQQKEAALTAHQTHVATIIAEHGIEVKKYAALNMQNEEQARANWKQMCDIIDEENLAAAKNAIKDFEAQQKHVAEENKKLAEQRLALQKRKREAEQWNDEVLQEKKLKWKQGCETAEKAYEQEVHKARVVHAKLCEETNLRNVEVLQAALLKHKAKVAAVQSYNETVRPFVEASNIVKAEVRRLEAFLKYLVKKCLPDPSSRSDADLELLAAADQPVRTKWLIEGLQVAYGTKATSDVRGEQKLLLPDESKKDLSGLLAIHPVRARAHHCRAAEHKLQIPSL